MKSESLLGQKFTPKDAKHFAHGVAFEVVEERQHNFVGVRGKEEPAVVIERAGHGSRTLRPRAAFLMEFIPVPAEKDGSAPE